MNGYAMTRGMVFAYDPRKNVLYCRINGGSLQPLKALGRLSRF